MNDLNVGHRHDHGMKRRAPRQVPSARDVLIGRQADILCGIADPGVAAVIWQRRMSTSFETWIETLEPEGLSNLRVTVPTDQAETIIHTACDIAKIPDDPQRQVFASDIGALASLFGDVMGIRQVRIRLDVSQETKCPKFHLDNVAARLLCTYRGTGTEYVSDHHLADASRIRTVRTGSVGLFRGAKWPSGEPTGLLHRSPDVRPGAGPRLLLVLDAGE